MGARANTPGISGAATVAGVVGWPIAHSLSPLLHGAWIEAAGLDAAYAPLAVKPDGAVAALRAIGALGLAGVNITLPHKETALACADEATPRARAVGAANVLHVTQDGGLLADNTDVAGVRYALREVEVAEGEALVLGAGGAARAVAYALQEMGWARLRILNRSQDRADALAQDARAWRPEAEILVSSWDERHGHARGAALIVNATSLGMTGKPALELELAGASAQTAVFDSVYTPLETPLLAAARGRGLMALDGLDMLIGQAIPSFEMFFGAPPPAIDARALLVEALEARA